MPVGSPPPESRDGLKLHLFTGGRYATVVRSDHLSDPGPHRHIVQLYQEEGALLRSVLKWISGPLSRGGAAILFCETARGSRIVSAAGAQGLALDQARSEGRFVLMDGREALGRFMVDGKPDADRFHAVVDEVIAGLPAGRDGRREIYAWGEMVNMLWRDGNREAAAQLESFWNDAIDRHGLRLLCSYELDPLVAEAHEGPFGAACTGHSLMVPHEDPAAFNAAVDGALVDVFGESQAPLLRTHWTERRAHLTTMPAAQLVMVRAQEEDPVVGRRLLAVVRERLRGRAD